MNRVLIFVLLTFTSLNTFPQCFEQLSGQGLELYSPVATRLTKYKGLAGKNWGDSVLGSCATLGKVMKKVVAPAYIVPANTPIYATHSGYLRIFTSGGNDETNDAGWIDGGNFSTCYFNIYFNVASNQYVYAGQLIGNVIARKDVSYIYFGIRRAPPLQPMMKRQILPVVADKDCHCYIDPVWPEYFVDPTDLRILWEYNEILPEVKIKINITPSWVGKWSFNEGKTWHKSGEEVSGLPIKYYKIIFNTINNWQSPLPIEFRGSAVKKNLQESVNYLPEKISDKLLKEASSRLVDSSTLISAVNTAKQLAYDSSHRSLRLSLYKLLKDSLDNKINKIEDEQKSVSSKNRMLNIIIPISLLLSLGLIIFYFQYQKIRKQKRYVEELQKEVHHRVRNNLGIIAGLIDASTVKDEFVIPVKDLESRIKSIGFVHEQLYMQDDITTLNLQNFLEVLCSNLVKTYSKSKEITYFINTPLKIEAQFATQIALIISEIITNSLKYGIVKDQELILTINASIIAGKKISIEITDNGTGLAPEYDFVNSKSYGIKMIHGLVKQMKGELIFNNEQGLTVKIIFKCVAIKF